MKTKMLLITATVLLIGILKTQAQSRNINLIEHETNIRQDVTTALNFFNDKQAVIRFRDIEINSQIKSFGTISLEDQVVLNLFQDVSFTATVVKVKEYLADNVTITAKIDTYNYAYMIVSTTEMRTFAVIDVPEINRTYKIISDPVLDENYLIELDPTLMESYNAENECQVIDDELTPKEVKEIENVKNDPFDTYLGPQDIANIDVMIIYTTAALTKANSTLGLGGISNLIAYAMALGQLVLDYSNTDVNLTLVYNSVIDYDESDDIAKDLSRLIKTSDGYMDDVHSWRDTYGADLVQLFGSGLSSAGIAKTTQNEAYAFSVVGVTHIDNYSSIHEMGHNMGCGHHKEQSHQPGPELYSYSAGWRWTGNDSGKYCSVMTYNSGVYFDDGINHDRLPYFSNPSVDDPSGVPTGDSEDGDNARTIRETKHNIAAYRDDASIGCISCPGYNFHIYPTESWKTTSASIGSGDCKIYRFNAQYGRTYYFKTGCGDGATADFDTKLFLLNNDYCTVITDNNDDCEELRSQIHWVASYDGYAYLRVKGNEGATGNYTLAFQMPDGCTSDLQNPSLTLIPDENWQYQDGLFPGEFCRFLVTEGITYHWSLCSGHGAEASYDSQLTLSKGSSDLILDFSDDVCGDDARISWTADFTGGVKVIISKSDCQAGSDPTTLAYKSGTLEVPYLTLTPNREVFSSAGTATFYLGSNTSWKLSKNASWITSMIPNSGSGNATITINYNANPSSLQREAVITATANAASDADVTLKQYPTDPYCNSVLSMGTMLMPTDEWQYNSEMFAGMFATTPVLSGTQYHWSLCSLHGAAVLYDADLILRRADNNEFIAYSDGGCGFNDAPVISWTADFTGNVKIILADGTCEYGDIARIGYKSGDLTSISISVSTEMIPLPFLSGTTTFSVYTELPWSIYIPPDKDPSWISVQPQNGVGNTLDTVTYLPNTTNIQREGSIIINAGDTSAMVTLLQMPNDGHCNSTSKSGGFLMPSENWQYYDNILSGEYANFEVDSGLTYHWSLCPQHGGNASFDSELTLRRADNNSFISYNNNTCGNDARISWTADYSGEVNLVLTEFPCNSTQMPARIAYKSGILANPFPIPGGSLTILTPVNKIVAPGGGIVTYALTSNTAWELTKDVDWITLSQTSGIGNATIIVDYEPNTGSERIANISGSVLYVPGVFANNTVTQIDFCNSETYLATETPSENWQYITCMKAGEYVIFPVTQGEKYQWSLCNAHGGNALFNSELTLRKASDNSFLSYSNNFNGVGQDAYLLWNADFTGDVKLVLSEINCQTSNLACARLAYKKGELNLPYLQISPQITYAGSDSGSIAVEIFSNTIWSLQKDAVWISSMAPNSGTGNAEISLTYMENTCLPREGNISASAFAINGINCSLIQDANLFSVPNAYAGQDATILTGQNYHITDAAALNVTSVEWTSDGYGYFSDPYIVNPTYIPGSGELGEINLTLSAIGMPGCNISSTAVLHIDTGMQINLDVRVMLDGAFMTDHMTTLLNQYSYLPLVQPYNTVPWNYQGTESVSSIPSAETSDWVLVELRHSEDEPDYIDPDFTVIDRRAGFLMSDGSIKDLDGTSYLNMRLADPAKTRVVVWHRNHISLISSAIIEPVNGNLFQWNFIDGLSKAYNNGQKSLGGGYFGMFAGDGNGNGSVDEFDKTSNWNSQVGTKGYIKGDFNMDGEVNNQDKNDFWLPNSGSGTQVPY